jgi:hypothetical protein
VSGELRAITVRLPWASVIADGVKLIENRTRKHRPTSYRGRVLIHAAQAWAPAGGVDPRVLHWWARRRFQPTAPSRVTMGQMPDDPGRILAVANLVDVHHDSGCCGTWADHGDVWHLVLADVRRLNTPVTAVGSLGLPWRITDERVAHELLAQIGGGR